MRVAVTIALLLLLGARFAARWREARPDGDYVYVVSGVTFTVIAERVQYYETLCSGAPAGPGFDGAAGVLPTTGCRSLLVSPMGAERSCWFCRSYLVSPFVERTAKGTLTPLTVR